MSIIFRDGYYHYQLPDGFESGPFLHQDAAEAGLACALEPKEGLDPRLDLPTAQFFPDAEGRIKSIVDMCPDVWSLLSVFSDRPPNFGKVTRLHMINTLRAAGIPVVRVYRGLKKSYELEDQQ